LTSRAVLAVLIVVAAVIIAIAFAKDPALWVGSGQRLALAGLVALWAAAAWNVAKFLKDTLDVRDRVLAIRDRRLLSKRLRRGPYDLPTIESATQYYIRPDCSNLDPAGEAEIRHALAVRSDLFRTMDAFIHNDGPLRHLILLADSGIGKTSFLLNYYAHNERLRLLSRRLPIALVALNASDADETIASIPNKQGHIAFLDAFDEDTKAIGNHHVRLQELMHSCREFYRVVMTCRSQFFHRDEEIPVDTGILRVGPRRAGTSGTHEFLKLYLAPFSDDQVTRYLRRRFPIWQRTQRARAKALIDKIPLLTVRPMLLAHIPEVSASKRTISHAFELYELMVQAWLQREAHWADPGTLRKISESLAVDIYTRRKERGTERIPVEELKELTARIGISLEGHLVTSRSLLNRDAVGNFKFAHRSIMEYLFVVQLLDRNPRCFGIEITDQMRLFICEIVQALTPAGHQLQTILDRCADVVILKGTSKVDSASEELVSGFYGLCNTADGRRTLTELGAESVNISAHVIRRYLTRSSIAGRVMVRGEAIDMTRGSETLDRWLEWFAQQTNETRAALFAHIAISNNVELLSLRTPSPLAKRIVEMSNWLGERSIGALATLHGESIGIEFVPLYDRTGVCALRIPREFLGKMVERMRV
jgi:hypothetical protein